MNKSGIAFVVLVALLLSGCHDSGSKTETAGSDEQLGLGQWLSYGRDYSEQRFFPASQINTETIDRLGLKYAIDLDAYKGISATPLLVDGMLIFPTNWNIVEALDARTGERVWQYDPEVPRETTRGMGGVSSRGVAVHEGKIIIPTMDGRLVAVTAKEGKKLWEVYTLDGGNLYKSDGSLFYLGCATRCQG